MRIALPPIRSRQFWRAILSILVLGCLCPLLVWKYAIHSKVSHGRLPTPLPCSSWLSETCLRESAVIRFVSEQIRHVKNIHSLVQHMGGPLCIVLDRSLITANNHPTCPEWPDDPARRYFLDHRRQWRDDMRQLSRDLEEFDTLHYDLFRSRGPVSSVLRRTAVTLDQVTRLHQLASDPNEPIKKRLFARQKLTELLVALPSELTRQILHAFSPMSSLLYTLVPQATATASLSDNVLQALTAILSRTEKEFNATPRILRWACGILNIRRLVWLRDSLPELQKSLSVIGRLTEYVDISSENMNSIQGYLRWLEQSSTDIIESYRPSNLRSFEEEVDAAHMELKLYFESLDELPADYLSVGVWRYPRKVPSPNLYLDPGPNNS